MVKLTLFRRRHLCERKSQWMMIKHARYCEGDTHVYRLELQTGSCSNRLLTSPAVLNLLRPLECRYSRASVA